MQHVLRNVGHVLRCDDIMNDASEVKIDGNWKCRTNSKRIKANSNSRTL